MDRQRQANARRILSGFIVAGAMLLPLRLIAGGRIQGRVMNGTSDRPATDQDVRLLNPGQGGMRLVELARTDASGRFVFTGAGIKAGNLYLLEAAHQGVRYHQPVRLGAKGTATANLKIYDSAARVPPFRISSARFLVRAKGEKVRVEELYALKNTTNPPVSYVNPGGTFFFKLGHSAGTPSVGVVGRLNVPLPQDVRPGKSSGQYFIRDPLKPGLTVVIVAYEADYSSQNFTLGDSVPYPIDNLEVDAVPSTLAVRSPLLTPAGNEPDSGGAKFVAENLKAGVPLGAAFSGAAAGSGGGTGSDQTVQELPNAMTRLGGPLLGCFLLVLLWAMGVRVSKEWSRQDLVRPGHPAHQQLQAKLDKLVNSIASLDELFEARKVPEKKYWRERLDLKAKLISILKSSPPAFLESYATRQKPQ